MTTVKDIDKDINELSELITKSDGVYVAHSNKEKYFITVNPEFDVDSLLYEQDSYLVFTTQEHWITLGDIRNSQKYIEAGKGMWKINDLAVRFFKIELV